MSVVLGSGLKGKGVMLIKMNSARRCLESCGSTSEAKLQYQ
jgi:hypothetical protein